MGEVLRKNISKLIFVAITCVLFSGQPGEASFREFQVFDNAYHLYLSYQPERAAEQFRVFLSDFPDSSAGDAALFWLAKSLLQMQLIGEANKTFEEMKMKFPESPFCRYVTQEMESLRDGGRPGKQDSTGGEKTTTSSLQRRITELQDREKYIINSAEVLDRMGIYDVLWRGNNMIEDIENETILYEEATKRNITADSAQLNRLIEFYSLNGEQAEYLRRYLLICGFLAVSMKDMFEKRDVELLTIEYQPFTGGDESLSHSSLLASELQMHARSGMSLEEMHGLYPEKTKYEHIGRKELQREMKDKAANLQEGETGIFWTENGFMMLRVIAGIELCNQAGYRQVSDMNEVRIFIKELTGERKRERHAAVVREQE